MCIGGSGSEGYQRNAVALGCDVVATGLTMFVCRSDSYVAQLEVAMERVGGCNEFM